MDSMNNVRSSEGCGTASSEEITGYSWKALLGSAIGYAMDGFDLLILGFMLHAISADLNLTPTQSGSPGNMDADWRCCGRHYFWRSERSLWPRPRSDLDNCAICYLYRIMRFCHRLLGPTDLPHHCRDRPWWRVRHRDGAGCRSMASTSPLTRFVICCVRAGRPASCLPPCLRRCSCRLSVGAACSLWV